MFLIAYVKEAKLRGSVFNPEDASGLVSSVDTNFFVDHAEPLEALAWVQEEFDGPLANYFLFLKARRPWSIESSVYVSI